MGHQQQERLDKRASAVWTVISELRDLSDVLAYLKQREAWLDEQQRKELTDRWVEIDKRRRIF